MSEGARALWGHRRRLMGPRVERDVDREGSSSIRQAIDADAAAVCFGDATHLCQTEAPAASAAPLGARQSVKRPEQRLLLLSGNVGAFIVNRDDGTLVERTNSDRDR